MAEGNARWFALRFTFNQGGFIANLKNSPAPWQDNGNGLIYGQCYGNSDEAPFVADVCIAHGTYTEQERANARLIEVAPELAEILDDLLNQIRELQGESSVIDEDLMQGEAFRRAVSILAGIRPQMRQRQDVRQLVFTWSIEDVQKLRPDLGDDQASEVLDALQKHENSSHGISWDTLESVAEYLYPEPNGE